MHLACFPLLFASSPRRSELVHGRHGDDGAPPAERVPHLAHRLRIHQAQNGELNDVFGFLGEELRRHGERPPAVTRHEGGQRVIVVTEVERG